MLNRTQGSVGRPYLIGLPCVLNARGACKGVSVHLESIHFQMRVTMPDAYVEHNDVNCESC